MSKHVAALCILFATLAWAVSAGGAEWVVVDRDEKVTIPPQEFSPIELYHGYLLGEEQIVAVHAGNFGWPGRRCLVLVRHFDEIGLRVRRVDE